MNDVAKASQEFLGGMTNGTEYIRAIMKLLKAKPNLIIQIAHRLAATIH